MNPSLYPPYIPSIHHIHDESQYINVYHTHPSCVKHADCRRRLVSRLLSVSQSSGRVLDERRAGDVGWFVPFEESVQLPFKWLNKCFGFMVDITVI